MSQQSGMLDDNQIHMIEDIYFETVNEAFNHGATPLTEHKEGVIAAAMLFSAVTGIEEAPARRRVVSMRLRPNQLDV